jgi:hypothetical protein
VERGRRPKQLTYVSLQYLTLDCGTVADVLDGVVSNFSQTRSCSIDVPTYSVIFSVINCWTYDFADSTRWLKTLGVRCNDLVLLHSVSCAGLSHAAFAFTLALLLLPVARGCTVFRLHLSYNCSFQWRKVWHRIYSYCLLCTTS